jgi:hypothetical protein
MRNFKTIKQIYDQLSSSEYECIGGFLKDNIAFQRLKELSEINYQPKFQLNEKVMFNAEVYYIRSIQTVGSSHPECEVEYCLSKEWNRPSTTNKTDIEYVNERLIMTVEDWDFLQVETAKKLLREKGIKI